jgi:hypothetical protein
MGIVFKKIRQKSGREPAGIRQEGRPGRGWKAKAETLKR